jgi:hypothetical protein
MTIALRPPIGAGREDDIPDGRKVHDEERGGRRKV